MGVMNADPAMTDTLFDSATSQRITTVPEPARDLHRTILLAFATTGTAPARAQLGADAGGHLDVLVDKDLIGLDRDGEIAYAYPFATSPTAHRVRLAGGARPFAMCAIDALGLPSMMDTDAVITSVEPDTGEAVTVTVTGNGHIATWEPATTVVLLASRPGCCSPATSAQTCCGTTNFFTTRARAQAWAAAHPDLRSVVLDQDNALRQGIRCFGDLLEPRRRRSANHTEPAVTDFRESGFVHLPSLLTADEVTRFRAAAEEALATRSNTDEEFGTRIVATTDAWEHHPTLRELALHPRIGALAEQLAGMSLRVWGGEVLRKDPDHSAPTGWHDDLTFALLDSRLIFNAWIALVDVPVERGCLTFLPGSHRRGGPERVELAEHTADPDDYLFTRWPELRWSPRVTVPLQAGDATFHQARTAHYAGANTGDQPRLSFLVTFTDAEATYRPLPGHDPLDLSPGQPLPDHRYPLV